MLFTDARFAREDPDGQLAVPRDRPTTSATAISATSASYERTGRFVISGLWDEIPQFYSVDTKTPYTGSGGNLVLDDATQQAIQQAKPAKLVGVRPDRVRSSISASAATSATSTSWRRRRRTST